MNTQRIASRVAAIPDFPIPGILFRDITPVLSDPAAFQDAIDALADLARKLPGGPPDVLVGMESRGFLFGAPLALALKCGFVPIRKPGKLPRASVRAEYLKEYGTDALEMHADALPKGARVAVVDDLLATGGTAGAAAELVTKGGGTVCGFLFVIELDGLKGRDRLGRFPCHAVLHY
jgi:adenine phosphoribosyltransferase